MRRKLLRAANDQAEDIAKIKPIFPDIYNRLHDNFSLLLAIAEHAGGAWPERTRKAVEFMAGRTEESRGTRLFTAFHTVCTARLEAGATEIVITSEEGAEYLIDFDSSYWENDWRGGVGQPGPITKNRLSALFKNYEIESKTVHPDKTASRSPRGFEILKDGKWDETWLTRFAQFCPRLPDIRTVKPKKKK